MYKFLFIIEKLFYLFKYFYKKINIFIKKFSFKKILYFLIIFLYKFYIHLIYNFFIHEFLILKINNLYQKMLRIF